MIRAYRWDDSPDNNVEECRAFKPKPERSLHEFVNKHLEELFGLNLVRSEFTHGSDARPDALAFDKKKKCFVILEYKIGDLSRLAWQLLKYDADITEAMKDAYSIVREENPDKFTIPIHNIQKEGYVIVVSTHFPNGIKKRLSKIGEIHLYEIHFFDGVLVLYKVDDKNWPHGDHVATLWPAETKAPSAENTVLESRQSSTILKLDYNKIKNKPVTLHFPDRKSIDFKSWAAVMRNISQWLYKNGHIYSAEQSTLLTEIRPARRYVKLDSKLFINLNCTAAQMLARIKRLILHIGYKPDGFTITVQGEVAKADVQYDVMTADTRHNINNTPSFAKSIQDLDYPKIKHSKPTKLYFPDGTSASPTKWAQVMREIAEWLHRHRYIKDSKQSNVLGSNVPTTNKGKQYNNVRLARNLFIKLQYNKKDTLQRVQKLLQDIGHEPASFKLVIESE